MPRGWDWLGKCGAYQLLGQPVGLEDVSAVDSAFAAEAAAVKAATASDWARQRRTWTTTGQAGRRVQLRPGGATTLVAYCDRWRYLTACAAARVGVAAATVAAMREGFEGQVPAAPTRWAPWRWAEHRACGALAVDVGRLREAAEYEGVFSADHFVADMFWRVLADFSPVVPCSAFVSRFFLTIHKCRSLNCHLVKELFPFSPPPATLLL